MADPMEIGKDGGAWRLYAEIDRLKADFEKAVDAARKHGAAADHWQRAYTGAKEKTDRYKAALEGLLHALAFKDASEGAHIEYCACGVCGARAKAREALHPTTERSGANG